MSWLQKFVYTVVLFQKTLEFNISQLDRKKTANKLGQWSWRWLVWDGPLWFFESHLRNPSIELVHKIQDFFRRPAKFRPKKHPHGLKHHQFSPSKRDYPNFVLSFLVGPSKYFLFEKFLVSSWGFLISWWILCRILDGLCWLICLDCPKTSQRRFTLEFSGCPIWSKKNRSVSNMDTCSAFFQSNLQNVEVVLGKKHVLHVSNKFICTQLQGYRVKQAFHMGNATG